MIHPFRLIGAMLAKAQRDRPSQDDHGGPLVHQLSLVPCPAGDAPRGQETVSVPKADDGYVHRGGPPECWGMSLG